MDIIDKGHKAKCEFWMIAVGNPFRDHSNGVLFIKSEAIMVFTDDNNIVSRNAFKPSDGTYHHFIESESVSAVTAMIEVK